MRRKAIPLDTPSFCTPIGNITMIDKDFKESYRLSHDEAFAVRLFRLPDADDGTLRLSIEVMTYPSSKVFFKLPEDLWMTPDNPILSGDLLNWDNERDILFFTTHDQGWAYIYDITLGKIVSKEIETHTRNLDWDYENKRWVLPYVVTFTKGQQKSSKIMSLPVLDLNAPAIDLHHLKTVDTETPKPTSLNDNSETERIILETPDRRFFLLLTKKPNSLQKKLELWEVRVIDIENATITTSALPFLVTGSDAIRFKNSTVHLHGVNPSANNSYIFNFNLRDLYKDDPLKVFVQDFEPTHPETIIWDGQFWRAVINGKVIIPGHFYFDNMYIENVVRCQEPIPTNLLRILPITEESRKIHETLLANERKRKAAEHERANTPADEIFRRMDGLNHNPKRRHSPKTKEPKAEKRSSRRNSGDFLTSDWFLLLITLLLVGMTFGAFFYVNSGHNLRPVATYRLFSAWATLMIAEISIILARHKDPYRFSLPKGQRMAMGYSSPFVLIALITTWVMIDKNRGINESFAITILLIALVSGSSLFIFGRRQRLRARKQRQYNGGCWMQFATIWLIFTALLALLSLLNA